MTDYEYAEEPKEYPDATPEETGKLIREYFRWKQLSFFGNWRYEH